MPGAPLELGDGVILGRGCTIAAQQHVAMARGSGAAKWTSIRDHDPAHGAVTMRTLQADVHVGFRHLSSGPRHGVTPASTQVS